MLTKTVTSKKITGFDFESNLKFNYNLWYDVSTELHTILFKLSKDGVTIKKYIHDVFPAMQNEQYVMWEYINIEKIVEEQEVKDFNDLIVAIANDPIFNDPTENNIHKTYFVEELNSNSCPYTIYARDEVIKLHSCLTLKVLDNLFSCTFYDYIDTDDPYLKETYIEKLNNKETHSEKHVERIIHDIACFKDKHDIELFAKRNNLKIVDCNVFTGDPADELLIEQLIENNKKLYAISVPSIDLIYYPLTFLLTEKDA